MIPSFRYNMLSIEDRFSDEFKRINTKDRENGNKKVFDNLLDQTQKMMAHMELSEVTEYDMSNFCFAFKEKPDMTKETQTNVQ